MMKPTVGDEDALMVSVPPRASEPPPVAIPEVLIVTDEFARSVFCTVAQVAVPAPLSERTNWLVHAPDPVYAVTVPFDDPKKSAFGTEDTVRLVVDAVTVVIIVDDAYGMESALDTGAVKLMVTAPVAPETEIPVPATFEVTPVLVTLPLA